MQPVHLPPDNPTAHFTGPSGEFLVPTKCGQRENRLMSIGTIPAGSPPTVRLSNRAAKRSRAWLKWSAAIGLLAVVAWLGWSFLNDKTGGGHANEDLLTYRVHPMDLPITVIERGNLESQINRQVMCEVDDFRSDGVHGTPIVWVIPNGSSVSEGDLICELDSTAVQSELDEQILDTEEARSAFIQAQANLENQEIVNQTAEDKAELDVALADLELAMFNDEQKGSYQLEFEAIQRQIDDLNNEILAAEMNLKLRRNEKVGIESLFKLGYAGKSEMDRSVLSYLQAEGDYAAKLNKLQTQIASREKLIAFDKKMQSMELEGRLRTSRQNLKQVLVTNKAKMAQMQGILTSRTEQLKKEEERLERYRTQYAKCKIYAPQDGMVAYAPPISSRDSEIAEGVPVRPRQHILSIPNLRSMQVQTSVHESVLDRIQPGLEVMVTVDAFPDRQYRGTVKSVAVLPERSYYSDTKSYKTSVTIDEEVYQLKPGMTAICEINVNRYSDVNAIPIQAVVQRQGANWVYVEQDGQLEKRQVSVGPSNDQYVVIDQGIQAGEFVVLNPGSIQSEPSSAPEPEIESLGDTQQAENLVATTEQPSAIN